MKPMLLALALLMASTLAPWTFEFVPATAAEPDCPPAPDKVPCLAESGDPMAMTMMGRSAFADGRESGDLTVALQWARRAVEAGNRRSGEMLLKMVYLQLGEGTHRDFVQAYVWLSKAIDNGDDTLLAWRKRLVGKMKPEQLAQAETLAVD